MDTFRSNVNAVFNGRGLDHQQQQQQHQQQQILGGVNTPINSAGTAAMGLPSRVVVGGGGGGSMLEHTTFHVSTSTEVDTYDEKRIEEICRALNMLEDIAHGRHIINWRELVDPTQPAESAKKISAALARPTTDPGEIGNVAECITTPAHLSIVALLSPPYLAKVREAVLQHLLDALSIVRDPNPMPLCSEMLVEMVQLNLVLLRGVARTLETFLSEPNSRRASIAVLGKLADQKRGDEVFMREMQNLESLVRTIDEPEYEYDCLTISRLLGWGGMDKAASLVPVKRLEQMSTVTSMAYFRQRDELVSATCDGTVTIWGSPHPSTGEVKVGMTIDLPQQCVPVAMDSSPRGNYLVIAGMPFPSVKLQFMENENRLLNSNYNYNDNTTNNNNSNSIANTSSKKRNLSASVAKAPLLRFVTCNESTGVWTNGETVVRKENTTLTAVAALGNFSVWTAESTPCDKLSDLGLQHDLVLSAHTAQTSRRIERAHDDYITVIRANEDNESILFTGGRDSVVKVWDTRSGSNRAGLSSTAAVATTAGAGAGAAGMSSQMRPNNRQKGNHTDTITSILPQRMVLYTASLDGSLMVWDTRHMSEPMREVYLTDPIIDLAFLDGGYMVVSTARGLNLFSRETLKAQDIIPNVAFTQLKSNNDGSVIFASGGSGVSVYALSR